MFGTMGQTNVKNLGNGGTMDGDVTITGDLTVSGGISLSLSEVLQGTSTIDINSTEALLVRKDGDGGDVFIVDTTNNDVTVGSSSLADGTLIIESNSSGDPKLQFTSTSNRIGIMDFIEGSTLQGSIVYDHNGDNLKFATGSTNRTARFVVNETSSYFTSNLGIGIASGDGTLHVHTATAGSVTADGASDDLVVENSGAGGISILTPNDALGQLAFGSPADAYGAFIGWKSDDNQMTIATANDGDSIVLQTANKVTALTIDSSQNVGIGHSAPATTMHVVSGTGITVSDTATDNTNPTTADGTTDKHLTIQRSAIRSHAPTNANSNLNIGMKGGNDSGAGAIIFQTGNTETERMRIQKNGNLGIGTSSFWAGETTAHTEISATKAGDYTGLILRNENTDAGDSVSLNFGLARDGGLNFGNAGKILVGKEADFTTTPSTVDSFMAFHTILNETSSEKMRLTSGGLLGIGTSSPAELLEIEGTSTAFMQIQATSADSTSGISLQNDAINYVLRTNGANSDSFEIRDATNNAQRLILDANSRISLSNNDASARNTIFGYQAMNVAGASASDNVAIGNEAMHDVGTSQFNVAVGSLALTKEVNGDRNTAIGYQSLYSQSNSGTEIPMNTAVGGFTGWTNVTGVFNTWVGGQAGFGSASGSNSNNVGVGYNSLYSVSTGSNNVALGFESGKSITTGSNNTVMGRLAGDAITTGNSNIVIGDSALGTATTATLNVVIGGDSMSLVPASVAIQDVVAIGQNAFKGSASTTDGANGTVAIGRDSLKALTSGGLNVAVGYQSGGDITTGGGNTLLGYNAGHTGSNNLVGGNNNTLIGRETKTSSASANNQIVIGKDATGQADNSVTLGNSSVSNFYLAPGNTSGQTINFNDAGAGGFVQYDHSDDQLKLAVADTINVRLYNGRLEPGSDDTQDLGSTTRAWHTLYVKDGINFPDDASANPSSDANTLDNYEEGTFSPTWVSGSGTLGSINYSNQVGKYTKIGNAVTITISFYNGSFDAGSGSGSLKITGLPFTSGAKSSLALGDTRLFGGDNPSEAEVTNSSTNVTLYFRTASNGANSELQVSDAGTGSGAFNLVTLSGTYFV